MNELIKVKNLINTSKYAKRELLANMLEEQNFKIHLRAESNAQQKDKEKIIESKIVK
jgi:hypothetical protein